MERRSFLGALTAASLGVALKGGLALEGSSTSSEFLKDSTIILVHGAWADGSCWKNVILPLERHGLRVICAPIPLTSLTDDAAALSRALERNNGPVVLVGHAYS